MLLVIAGVFGACWGSFLNVAACRLLTNISLMGRSACPRCNQAIAWYDLVPLFSFCALLGRCRSCRGRISWLYPFIEAITAIVFVLIVMCTPPRFWLAYCVFFSALIITVRTDIESYAVLRICSLYLAPIGCLCACLGLLPISCVGSMAGAIAGYGALWLVARVYRAATGIAGMGEGDMELLACIGAFLGVHSLVPTVLVASLAGTLVSLGLLARGRAGRYTRVPFGPFLALGALFAFVFLSECAVFGLS